MFGLFLIFCALFLFLALFTFDARDPSINFVKSGAADVRNAAGLFGAYAAGLLNDFFGIGALLWPCVFAALGAAHLSVGIVLHWWRWTGFFLLTLCLLAAASAWDWSFGDLSGGGVLGDTLDRQSIRYLSPFGSFLLWLFVFLAGIQLVANFSWIALCHLARARIRAWLQAPKSGDGAIFTRAATLAAKGRQVCAPCILSLKKLLQRLPLERAANPASQRAAPAPVVNAPQEDDDPFASSQNLAPAANAASPQPFAPAELSAPEPLAAPPGPSTPDPFPQLAPEPKKQDSRPPAPAAPAPAPSPRLFQEGEPELPSVELLKAAAPVASATPAELEAKGQALMACFANFDIQGELARITPGPVVTMFEVRPAPGIRVSKIANLADDLSRALKAVAVRIQAPVPGSDTVGIEIPNERRETVNFRQLAETEAFRKDGGALTMILGKNIAGAPYMADLARMPHMLVAGATGAGKSVCLNSILVSLLFRLPPAKMRLLLVDPKRIELSMYADLPHLVHPVVTEMDDAKNALEWAVDDMKRRYKTFERLGVKNIAGYNEKLASYGAALPPGLEDLAPMSYMVIVIDELADLMMTAAREVETSIVRLAQLARAAGIHMILATQRPSVDVVTGLIKANFPCRISFQVTSKHDSRTILDQVGAEHLLGRGDMLFKPSGQPLMRLHGPFLSDEEVQAVAAHWRAQQPPDYQVDFAQWSAETASATGSVGGDATADALYGEARSFVLDQGRASISLLQRHLKIGFNRAARLMEQFEREGLIGPADGSKPRNVLR